MRASRLLGFDNTADLDVVRPLRETQRVCPGCRCVVVWSALERHKRGRVCADGAELRQRVEALRAEHGEMRTCCGDHRVIINAGIEVVRCASGIDQRSGLVESLWAPSWAVRVAHWTTISPELRKRVLSRMHEDEEFRRYVTATIMLLTHEFAPDKDGKPTSAAKLAVLEIAEALPRPRSVVRMRKVLRAEEAV